MNIPLAIGLSLYVFTVVAYGRNTGSQSTIIRNIRIKDTLDSSIEERKKRSKILVDIGAAAVDYLLDGARALRSYSQQWKRYEKSGNLFTAIREFYKVKPTNVYRYKQKNGVDVLEGDLGDRTIYLRTKDMKEKGSPTIEVFDPKKAQYGPKNNVFGQPSEKFVYRKIQKTQ